MSQVQTSRFNHKKYQSFQQSMPALKMENRQWPSNTITQAPQWCAVDLRDGNQALIEPMSVAQKQKMWTLMVKMGFKHIEVGFPSASQPDFDFVRWLIEENQIPEDVTIQVLTQARDALIERTYQSLAGAERAIVHVYNSTSPVQREKVFGLDKQGIIDIATHGAEKVLSESKKYPMTDWTFEYSPESFSSTETDFAIDVCNAVIDVWQPSADNKAIINLPATVECAGPNVFADQVETFCNGVKQRENIIISIHTHNDRGCAVAAAEMAILAGADRIEGTLMGNGERTGNMDLITMAMNLYSQGIDPEIDVSIADEVVATVEECTQIKTHPRHPWFGELVYTAFSGSHQDAIKKCLSVQRDDQQWDVAYLPIDPRDLGRDYQSVIRVNSQSGKGGVAYIMETEFGINLPRWMQIELSRSVQEYSVKNSCEVDNKTIYEIFQQQFVQRDHQNEQQYQVLGYEMHKQGEQESIQASICDGTTHGETITIHGQGKGIISALSDGLHKTLGIDFQVQHFDQIALSKGTHAQAMAFVQIKINDLKFMGISQHQDIMTATINSVLASINSYLEYQKAAA
ncbi:MAG: 2-isopropylmalate synthase [Methylophagaceae bacterium]|jgi:2-isopropylmalate synthase